MPIGRPVNGSPVIGAVVAPPTAVVVAPTAVVVTPTAVVVAPGTVVVVVPGTVVVVVVGTLRLHVGEMKVSVSSVTAPLRASARPRTVTPVVTVIDVRARMFPANIEFVPRVAELPTCQKTLHSWAPLINVTELPDAVVRVESV